MKEQTNLEDNKRVSFWSSAFVALFYTSIYFLSLFNVAGLLSRIGAENIFLILILSLIPPFLFNLI